jgi:hypothetical protein
MSVHLYRLFLCQQPGVAQNLQKEDGIRFVQIKWQGESVLVKNLRLQGLVNKAMRIETKLKDGADPNLQKQLAAVYSEGTRSALQTLDSQRVRFGC